MYIARFPEGDGPAALSAALPARARRVRNRPLCIYVHIYIYNHNISPHAACSPRAPGRPTGRRPAASARLESCLLIMIVIYVLLTSVID